LAADGREMRFAGNRSFRHFSVNRRDVHAIHARSAPWRLGRDHVRIDLDARDLWRHYERDSGRFPTPETRSFSLPRNGVASADRSPSTSLARTSIDAALVTWRWHSLYGRRDFLRKRAPAI